MDRDKEQGQGLETLAGYAKELAAGNLLARLPKESGNFEGTLKELRVSLEQIRERMAAWREEAIGAKKYAELIENDNELLVELLSKRNEWLLVVDADSKEILYCNKREKGKDGGSIVCETCRKRLSFRSELLDWSAENGQNDQYNVWEIEGENETYYRITSFPVEWKDRRSHVHIVVDVTDEKQTAHTLASKAYHDPGTGIRNRLFFEEYMENILAEQREATLCYLDLDGLKYVNDTFGHLEGDIYIQNFVEMIRSSFRNDDTFARTGGDEFCLVLTGRMKTLIDHKMAEILHTFQSTRYAQYQCSFSYGIVEIEGKDNEWTLDEILQKADAAMYECKRRNKEKYPTLVR
ncbi:MAG: GGDEF domain-containing protein [Lachnospiraceae bacterium]|jgi:diguanylate cyclase (GGDEF)-like protein|nr:GGDEF domain-containing protein [Lachnospiraceae bacterium]